MLSAMWPMVILCDLSQQWCLNSTTVQSISVVSENVSRRHPKSQPSETV